MTTDTRHSPWNDYDARAGMKANGGWDCEGFPYVVRWSVSVPDRLTRWRSINRSFATLDEAVAAYKRPFRGLDVDLVKYNGKPPGQHLDRLAHRKCSKPTKWHPSVPAHLREQRCCAA